MLTPVGFKPANVLRQRQFSSHIESDTLSMEDPVSFDARDKWPKCIGPVADQGKCKSGWALASVAALSDRTCIANNSNTRIAYSTMDVLAHVDTACRGGSAESAHEFFRDAGVVDNACQPYGSWESPAGPIPRCPFDQFPCMAPSPTPTVTDKCMDGRSYVKAKKRVRDSISVYGAGPMAEALLKYGPLTVTIDVYDDFLYYSDGIYTHYGGTLAGQHSMKLIGYGTDNNVDYWLLQNHWTERFGEKGYVRIIRGKNEVGIETSAFYTVDV